MFPEKDRSVWSSIGKKMFEFELFSFLVSNQSVSAQYGYFHRLIFASMCFSQRWESVRIRNNQAQSICSTRSLSLVCVSLSKALLNHITFSEKINSFDFSKFLISISSSLLLAVCCLFSKISHFEMHHFQFYKHTIQFDQASARITCYAVYAFCWSNEWNKYKQ